MKLIGAGFGRTGTMSLKVALETLQGTFDGCFENKHHAIGVFKRHNAEVQRRVPEDRLLVYDVNSGWGPLCEFLGVKEPEEPFPRTNDAAEMQRRLRGVKAISIAVPVTLTLLAGAAVVLLRRRA